MSRAAADLLAAIDAADVSDDAAFSSLLVEVMDALGLRDEDVADALHVSRPGVERWRRGANLPYKAVRPLVFSVLKKRLKTRTRV